MDQLDVLRGLVTELNAKVDALTTVVQSTGASYAGEFGQVYAKITVLEGQIKALEVEIMRLTAQAMEDRAAGRRAIDEAIASRVMETKAIMNHISSLESELRDRRDKDDLVIEAVGAIVDELGLESQVRLGSEPKKDGLVKLPKLQGIEKSSRQAKVVQAIIAIGVAAQTLNQIYHSIFR